MTWKPFFKNLAVIVGMLAFLLALGIGILFGSLAGAGVAVLLYFIYLAAGMKSQAPK